MKVLIACEESQTVCKAFRARGHEAYSCDVQEPSGGHPEWHVLGDALDALLGGQIVTMDGTTHDVGTWDLLIAHPPCTYLTNVGSRHYSLKMNTPEKVIARMQKREEAIVFFMQCMLAPVDKICVENPLGRMSAIYRKPDQVIHPYFFSNGEDDAENYEKKRTCLWLKNLPLLKYSAPSAPKPKGYTASGRPLHFEEMCTGRDKAKMRSKTFPGVAEAMAEQWG